MGMLEGIFNSLRTVKRRKRLLRVEPLEERTLFAVYAGFLLALNVGGTPTAAGASAEQPSPVVTTIDDTVDPEDGYISLREAIDYAGANQTVTFADTLYAFDNNAGKWIETSSGTIHLRHGSLTIDGKTRIIADKSKPITVDAGGNSRVFYVTGSAALTGLTITGGSVPDAVSPAGNGGGIQVYGGSLVMSDCIVTGNSARTSGGLDLQDGSATIVNSIFTDNTSTGDGGAIQNYHGFLEAVNTLFADNVNSGNDGGTIVNYYASTTLTNCTISGNMGSAVGGIYNQGALNIYNTIILGNSGDVPDLKTNNTIVLASSLWNPSACSGQISASRCRTAAGGASVFADFSRGDYSLADRSPANNAGNNDYVTVRTDLAGNPRLVGGTVDMGAYENQKTDLFVRLSAPEIITGSHGVYVSYGANRHRITWSEIENADGYELSYSPDGRFWTSIDTAETSAVIGGLTYGANVIYRIRALSNGSHVDSDWSVPKTFRVNPIDINNDGDISGGDRTLLAQSWLTEEGDDNYRYYADIDGDGDVSGKDRAFLSENWLGEVATDEFSYPPAIPVDVPDTDGDDFVFVTTDAGAGGYEAFPDVCRLADGRLFCVFYDGYGHIAWPDANIFKTGGRVSGCYSEDEGKTWSEPFVVFDSPFDDRDPSVTMLEDGTVLCTFFLLDKPVNPGTGYRKLGTWFIRSADGGATWSEPTPISDRYWVSSPIRVLENGRWIVGLYGEEPDWEAVVAISDDQGNSWRPVVIPTGNLMVDAETDVIQRSDGSLLAFMRHREGQGPLPMAWSVSYDNGNTWQQAESAGFSGHCPYLYKTPEGVFVLGTRTGPTPIEGYNVVPSSTTIRISFDEGRTWSVPETVDYHTGAYPSMVTLKDGSTLIVYYEEGDGSNIRARRFRIENNRIRWLKL